MSGSELERFFLGRQRDYSVWENGTSASSIDSVDEDLLKRVFEKDVEARRINYEYSGKKPILSKLGLLSPD